MDVYTVSQNSLKELQEQTRGLESRLQHLDTRVSELKVLVYHLVHELGWKGLIQDDNKPL